MGQRVSRTDFEWTDQEEPHANRRKEILKKYPQIKELFGYDRMFQWKVLFLVAIQLIMIPIVANLSWGLIFIIAYCFGGVINHALMVSCHELAHNLSYGHARPLANRILGFVANLPTGVPFSVSFKKYHLDHHRYQADELFDPDVPSDIEARLFCSTVGKLVWVILLPFFYGLRPLVRNPKPPGTLEIINFVIQLSFNFFVYYFFGWKALVYLLGGSALCFGLHPVAGHLISEHYMFRKGFETYSYYGPLNYITFNVGYHNEHHDFPAVPGCNLPKVREIAKEYYNTLPHHDSWVKVIYDFIMDPAIGPYARIKRKNLKIATEKKAVETHSKTN